MLSKQTVLAGVVLALSAVAAQAGDNALQPDYFWGKTQTEAQNSGERYVDARNPLNPSYYSKSAWEATAQTAPYIDDRNPRYPFYKKF
jgi:hypothetical protein